MVYEAVQRFAAYNIGALAVTNDKGKVIGIVSERDYVSKVNTNEFTIRTNLIHVGKTVQTAVPFYFVNLNSCPSVR